MLLKILAGESDVQVEKKNVKDFVERYVTNHVCHNSKSRERSPVTGTTPQSSY